MRPGRDADPSPPSSAEVKNRASYTPTLPKGLRGLERVKPTYLPEVKIPVGRPRSGREDNIKMDLQEV